MPIGDRRLRTEELGRPAPGDLRWLTRRPVRVLLDDVRSRHNVGAVFRTADAFAIEGITLCGFTPRPPHREMEKTALGATATVPWDHAPDAAAAVRSLQARGYRVLAVEQTLKALSLPDLTQPPAAPLALVFGNELHGVSDAVIEACDECVSIPQQGAKHSLNVSVCAGVVLWWFAGR